MRWATPSDLMTALILTPQGSRYSLPDVYADLAISFFYVCVCMKEVVFEKIDQIRNILIFLRR